MEEMACTLLEGWRRLSIWHGRTKKTRSVNEDIAMIQIQDITKTKKLSSNALQAIHGGKNSRIPSFSKRSEVKDSHDRYANIEVSYFTNWGAIAPNSLIAPVRPLSRI